MGAVTSCCRTALLAALTLCAAGCTVIAGREGVSYRNLPNTGDQLHLPATRVPRASAERVPQKDVFVGVALSGGGSRSANFGFAVLTELEQLGLLEHVDALSAASGGSIPAAYFAVNGSAPDWVARGREAVGANLLLPLVGRLLNPVNIVATTFTDRDRSDSMAEIFEERFFGGRRITYGDLGPRGPMRPALYINATDTTTGGTRFVFTEDVFVRNLGSDLSRYPLAWAMAASAAFPGAFNSVTLRRYPIGSDGAGAPARYLHLIDGGVSDNLGVQTLIEQARAHHIATLRANRQPRGCFLFVVDAHVPGTSQSESLQSDRRNIASMLIDLNFLDGIDSMLSNHRDESLAGLGIRPDQPSAWFSIDLGQGQIEYDVRPYQRVGEFNATYYEIDGLPIATPVLTVQRDALPAQTHRATPRQFPCTAWHVALRDIHAIPPWQHDGVALRPLDPASPAGQALLSRRARLARVIEQVSTSYRLVGPPDCTPERVQQALFDAARIAVRQDKLSLDAVCDWFASKGMAGDGRCRAQAQPLDPSGMDVVPITTPRDRGIAEQQANRYVRCLPEADAGLARQP